MANYHYKQMTCTTITKATRIGNYLTTISFQKVKKLERYWEVTFMQQFRQLGKHVLTPFSTTKFRRKKRLWILWRQGVAFWIKEKYDLKEYSIKGFKWCLAGIEFRGEVFILSGGIFGAFQCLFLFFLIRFQCLIGCFSYSPFIGCCLAFNLLSQRCQLVWDYSKCDTSSTLLNVPSSSF